MIQFHNHDTILTYDGHRMKQLPPMKPRTTLLWKFFDEYLAPASGPVTILPPVPGHYHSQEEATDDDPDGGQDTTDHV
jgi:hypothetical protein